MSSKKNINIDNANASVKILKQIRAMMIEDNISIKNLSSIMHISLSSLSGLFRQKNISLNKLQDICNALNYKLEINITRINTDVNNTIVSDAGLTQVQLQHILAYAQKVMQADSNVDVDSSSIDTSVSVDDNGKDGKDI